MATTKRKVATKTKAKITIKVKEIRNAVLEAEARGWRVERKGRSGHLTIRHKDFPGHWYPVSASPSDRNAAAQITRGLVRCEQGRCQHGAPYPHAEETPTNKPEATVAKVQERTEKKLNEIAAARHDAVKWSSEHIDMLVEAVNTFESVKEAFIYVAGETGIGFSRVQAQYYRWMRQEGQFASRIERKVESKHPAKRESVRGENPPAFKPAPRAMKKGKYHILTATEMGDLFLAFAAAPYDRAGLAERFNISPSTVSNHYKRFQEVSEHITAKVAQPTISTPALPVPTVVEQDDSELRAVVGDFLSWYDSGAEYKAAMDSDIPESMKSILRADRDAKKRDWTAEFRSAYEAT